MVPLRVPFNVDPLTRTRVEGILLGGCGLGAWGFLGFWGFGGLGFGVWGFRGLGGLGFWVLGFGV